MVNLDIGKSSIRGGQHRYAAQDFPDATVVRLS